MDSRYIKIKRCCLLKHTLKKRLTDDFWKVSKSNQSAVFGVFNSLRSFTTAIFYTYSISVAH